MISVVIPALQPVPALVDTLTALVPAVAEGLVRDVVIVAENETPFLTAVTEAGGSLLVIAAGNRKHLIAEGAQRAKSAQCLVIEPGMVPQGDWIAVLADAQRDVEGQRAGLMPMIGAPWLTWAARLFGVADPRLGILAMTAALRTENRLRFMTVPAFVADRRQRGLRSAAG